MLAHKKYVRKIKQLKDNTLFFNITFNKFDTSKKSFTFNKD